MQSHACVRMATGFDCYTFGGMNLLNADMSEPCPTLSTNNLDFAWMCLAAALYPLGTPLLMYISMVRFGVPRCAKRKINDAILSEMLKKYREIIANTLWGKIANYIGAGNNTGEDAVLKQRAEQMFDACFEFAHAHLDPGASRGELAVSADQFLQYLDFIGVSGKHKEEVESFMQRFDEDGSGLLDKTEFAVLHTTTSLRRQPQGS
eukprot:1076439-Rhodomonas_salina.3